MESKKELKDFIEENRYLLTAMGVLGGLTTLFQRLGNASILVLISFIMFILVGLETYAQFWKNIKVKKTLRLVVFENLTLSLIITVCLYTFAFYFSDLMLIIPSIAVVLVIYFQSAILKFLNPNFQTKRDALIDIGLIAIIAFSIVGIVVLLWLFFGLS